MRLFYFFFCFAMVWSSCVTLPRSFHALSYNPKEQRVFLDRNHSYRVGPLSSDWVYIRTSKPGVIFKHQRTQSTLSTQAQCGAAFEDLPPQILTHHLFTGFENTHILHQENWRLSQREGLYTKAQATLDGAQVLLNIFVIKKDRCQFDFWAISSPQSDAKTTEDFVHFVRGFEY